VNRARLNCARRSRVLAPIVLEPATFHHAILRDTSRFSPGRCGVRESQMAGLDGPLRLLLQLPLILLCVLRGVLLLPLVLVLLAFVSHGHLLRLSSLHDRVQATGPEAYESPQRFHLNAACVVTSRGERGRCPRHRRGIGVEGNSGNTGRASAASMKCFDAAA
jgi:hypothetical protein